MIPSLAAFLAQNPAAVLIEITGTQGSVPRETGTFMLVSQHDIWGTIGGGQFEFLAIANARAMLGGGGIEVMDIPLGPEIGQCCGGRTQLRCRLASAETIADLHRRLDREAEAFPQVTLFGAGHVGRALTAALRPLPVATLVVETRREELDELPDGTATRLLAMPEALVAELPPGSVVLILTHDHALDFLIAREALARSDLAYVGMIGSATKRATFAHWLTREGGDKSSLERLTLPIGGGAVKDKRPEVIAAMTAAEILTALAAYRSHGS
ncbi:MULTISPECIES: xanthine dehydrogenase accessory protein XdhC [unclassified Rhizobium]|uniref:xanthine dehydrogenase accessory protein XdhC n=1 Tax=unclassified Rhizobium TaxID=2613769 RepID=UPI001ADBEEA1|nr:MULTISPECIES: xanthine dehydrogenase accessory protein XdhC [unclassified Rhizobium]MBO9099132.1 xanthine dehydrogenase accessory protein XdhC [Rhizobium sp. L58/93]MBO9132062.1 xanthine dehydrogenase accessory protein XdhC [Rhizobium sp. B209b/85]MBO9169394.1 xanthine dehydrogenase accessory protein XdhC [Rhizobium sp. L245/93]MBO9185346.1 xanthine dehydrogenase accessory protein XdhC [Rhizobium sp. E27B/91]QXZ85484.1 xanthine dehydrogenase accessory protein XdhC [Rhizobium sp. K1/93]